MGGHFYWYVVPYEPDIRRALDRLREQEFAAGRYYPVLPYVDFPLGADAPRPGARHRTIRDAVKATRETGTRSILDLDRVADEPDYGAVAPLSEETLLRLYGTGQPTRAMVEPDLVFSEEMDERGQGVYVILHRDGEPHEILFAGYSYD